MKLIFIIFTFIATICQAKTVKIVVIDSGFDGYYKKQVNFCKNGHLNLSYSPLFTDNHGHGTNVIGLIVKNIKVDYCIILIKAIGIESYANSYTKALLHVKNLDYDIMNLSISGSKYIKLEDTILKSELNKGRKIVVAAGNDSKDLNKECNAYPACLDRRLIVVGNVGNKTNRGKVVDLHIDGNNKKAFDTTSSGSSQSAAIITGKIANTVKN
jgi:subtilisin family serine protease